jgi:toxin CptA
MTIAVSVLSQPSRTRMLLMAIVSTALIGVGTIAFLQSFGSNYGLVIGIAASALMLVMFAWRSLFMRWGMWTMRLTIAENGQMRLLRYRSGHLSVSNRPEIVEMMQGSTLWSFFILLRLRQHNKKTIVVPFFLGSLSPRLFRRLSVACRWIAARNDAAGLFQVNSDRI